MKRRLFLTRASLAAAAALVGCGGGNQQGVTPATPSPSPTPPANPPPAPASPPPPFPTAPSSSTGLPALDLRASQTGLTPYLATILPLEGAVPSGRTVVSPDDASLRSSIISRWPDGSASVVVVSGEMQLQAGSATRVRVATGSTTAQALTAERVGQLISKVTIECPPIGTISLTSFDSPSRIWWANERTICCRYRAPIGSDGTLEAQIDIHAFSSNRALVEVVIENGKLNSVSPTRPSDKSYTASVSVNGTEVAATSSAGAPSGAHEPFRAWYAKAWVGGDPGVEVTHDPSSLHAHPLFYKPWKQGGSMSGYANDAYAPWRTGRLNVPGMGGTGDDPAIGPLSRWDAHYLQTGDPLARRAVIATALHALTCNINYRDAASGNVPSLTSSDTNSFNSGTYPKTTSEPAWEVAHAPAVGLVAFLCQPSPAFIEIAQKVAFWTKTWGWWAANSPNRVYGPYYQIRGKAWSIRNHVHALFLTPDDHPWKPDARRVLDLAITSLDGFRTVSSQKLGAFWNYDYDFFNDYHSATGGQTSIWEGHFLIGELHRAANAKVLGEAGQERLARLADWAALQPVRYVNEAAGGSFRVHRYMTTVSRVPNGIDQLSTWGEMWNWEIGASAPLMPEAGPWVQDPGDGNPWPPAATYGSSYDVHFWAALVAAVERGVAGADAAWSKVQSKITNLASWSEGFSADPRFGSYPRNK